MKESPFPKLMYAVKNLNGPYHLFLSQYKQNFADYSQSNNTSTDLDDDDEHQKLQSTTTSYVESPTTPSYTKNTANQQQQDYNKKVSI